MKPLLPLLCSLFLGACVDSGASVQTAGGMALSVTLDDNYYWYATMPGHPEVEVFPLVTALVVARKDGGALTEGDEVAARQAVVAHCKGLGLDAPGPSSNFADGTWAYYPCPEA